MKNHTKSNRAKIERLFETQNDACWKIGDAFLSRESPEMHMRSYAAEQTAYTYAQLQRIVFVCRSIPPELRNYSLTFAHHAEVVYLRPDTRARMLQEAAEQHMTAYDLRRAVRTRMAEYRADREPPRAHIKIFNLVRWVHKGQKFFRHSGPVSKWTPERRRLIASDLEPIAAVYQELVESL